MNIDRKRVKILTITQDISETLKQGQDIIFQGSASVIEARFRDNQDQTTNATYIAKPILIDVRPSETNISIVDDKKLKEKSRSQALRQKCFVIAQEIGENADDLYERIMDFANDELDRIQDEKKI
jgi:hypothetical protein